MYIGTYRVIMRLLEKTKCCADIAIYYKVNAI